MWRAPFEVEHRKSSTWSYVWASQRDWFDILRFWFPVLPLEIKGRMVSLTRHLISASRDPQEDPSFLRNQSRNGKNLALEDHVSLISIPVKFWCLPIQVYKPLPLVCCWNHIHKLQHTAQGTPLSSPGLYNSWSRFLEEKRKGWFKKKCSASC